MAGAPKEEPMPDPKDPQPAAPVEPQSEAQKNLDLATEWLKRQLADGGKFACPVNEKHTGWIIAESLIALPVAPKGKFPLGTTFPSFMLICNGCGYSMLFNWGVVLGQFEKGVANG